MQRVRCCLFVCLASVSCERRAGVRWTSVSSLTVLVWLCRSSSLMKTCCGRLGAQQVLARSHGHSVHGISSSPR